MANPVAAVEACIAKMARPQRDTLLALRATLRRILPRAEECMKYGMPSFAVQGKGVAGYCAFKEHCSYFPFSGRVLGKVGPLAAGRASAKGTLQFPVDEPLPVAVVRKLVRARLAEISDVADGKRYDFYDDGGVKAVGSMKRGRLHGKWSWYRRDGTLMRTGQFKLGERTGTWESCDARGRPVKRTVF